MPPPLASCPLFAPKHTKKDRFYSDLLSLLGVAEKGLLILLMGNFLPLETLTA